MTSATAIPDTPALAATIETLRQLSADPGIWDTLPSADGAAPYLPWHTVTRILDAGAPGWEVDTVAIHETAEAITVTVRLSIAGVGRCASYQQAKTGKRRDGNVFQVSAPLEKAERRALARAAGLFGLGAEAPDRRQVRRGNSPPAQPRPARSEPRQAAGPPRPPHPADGNPDTMEMIDRLPPDATRFTEFLRRMQGADAGEIDKRYLWDTARWHGLTYDPDAGEFVQAAG